MAATDDREMESLLSSFDQIYEDFKSGIVEMQSLKSNCQVEARRREAIEITCDSLKQDNERLTKLYTSAMHNMADELEHCVKSQNVEEELKRVIAQQHNIENEHRRAVELLKQDYEAKLGNLEAQIRCFHREKRSDEATINHLHQDLTVHRSHIQSLASRFEQARFEKNSNYQVEIQDLKECLLLEQEEKNDLTKKLKDLEKELLICRTKLGQEQRNLASSQQVEGLKQKMMKLRRENEVLKKEASVIRGKLEVHHLL